MVGGGKLLALMLGILAANTGKEPEGIPIEGGDLPVKVITVPVAPEPTAPAASTAQPASPVASSAQPAAPASSAAQASPSASTAPQPQPPAPGTAPAPAPTTTPQTPAPPAPSSSPDGGAPPQAPPPVDAGAPPVAGAAQRPDASAALELAPPGSALPPSNPDQPPPWGRVTYVPITSSSFDKQDLIDFHPASSAFDAEDKIDPHPVP